MKKFKGGFIFIYYFWLLLFLLIVTHEGYSISFRLYDVGAKAQGQGGAFTAQADNPTAIFYNPAGLTNLAGNQVLVGSEFLQLNTDYTPGSGITESSDNDMGIAPHLFATTHINSKWALGFGASSDFGLATEYSDRKVLKYISTSSELRTMNLSPVLAYQINSQLSVGGGVNVLLGNLDLRKKVDFGALAGFPGSSDGDFRIEADGEAVGFNVGALYQPHPQHRFGIVYHSPLELDLNGHVGLVNIPPFVGAGLGVRGNLSTELDLPSIVRVGYAFYPTEKWKLEFDFDWTLWTSFKSLNLQSTNPLVPSTIVPENHDDGFVFGLGTEYLLNAQWSLRAGGGHVIAAVPDSTFSPIIPDADRNFLTVGFSWEYRALTIDFAYQAVFFSDRHIDNEVGMDVGSTVDGLYESFVHAVTVDATIRF